MLHDKHQLQVEATFLVKLRFFQKNFQIIDFFFRRKIVNVVIVILTSNFIFF